MGDESAPGRPDDPSPRDTPADGDEVTKWVSGTLDDISQAQSEPQRPASKGQGDQPSPSEDQGAKAIETGVAGVLVEGARRKRSRLWRAVWYLVGVVVLVAILSVVLGYTGVVDELSCGNDQDLSTSFQDAQQPPAGDDAQPGYRPESPEQPATPQKSASDPYLEARAALGLNTTPPESITRYNSGTAPLRYAFKWLDEAGSEMGDIGTVTLTRDDVLGNGRVTIEDSTAVGAYKMGKVAGAQNVGVDFAIRIPGPDGGEPQLIVFRTENTANFTLTGSAAPLEGPDPKPAWKVMGKQIRD
jgi:hypothetical protein